MSQSYTYVYSEGNEDNAEDDNIRLVFKDFDQANTFLKHRVEKETGCRLDECLLLSIDETEDSMRVNNTHSDDGEWWTVTKEYEREFPEDEYKTINAGKYQYQFQGISYDKSWPYLQLLIFEFDENNKPLNRGRFIRKIYLEFGGSDLLTDVVRKEDLESFAEYLAVFKKNNEKVDLYFEINAWNQYWKDKWAEYRLQIIGDISSTEGAVRLSGAVSKEKTMDDLYCISIDDDNIAYIFTAKKEEALKDFPVCYCMTNDRENAWEIAYSLNNDYLGNGADKTYFKNQNDE